MTDKTTSNLQDVFTSVTGETTVTEEQEETDTRVRGEEADGRPRTETICPDCGHNKPFYELKQIRAADESETRFFECTDCGKTWREDDH